MTSDNLTLFPRRPSSQILVSLISFWLLSCLIAITWGVVFWWALLVVPFAATAGIVMGATFPFAAATKIQYVVGLLLSLLGVVLGWRKREFIWARFLCVLAVLTWCLLGVLGLGTGT